MGTEISGLFGGLYQGKRVLVTGDTGFKGSWLSIWLREMGAEVYGYALPPKTELDNFVQCGLDRLVHHRDGDVRNREDLIAFFQKVQPHLAFHLAAQPIVLDSYQDPHYTFETNMMGVVNFFEAVRQTPSVKVAVNITSDKCYQNNEWVWGYRETDPMGGHDPYSASKGCSELITQSYIRSFFSVDGTCNVASARAGNVIGGGDWAPYRIVPDFFRAVKERKPLIIRNPEAVRPWQHVLEPLGGYLLLGSKLWSGGKRFSGGWNFGPVETNHATVRELIEALINISGMGAYQAPEMQDQPHEANLLKLDISKANTVLKWKPVLNFTQTVDFTASGYLEQLKSADNMLAHRNYQIKTYTAKSFDK